MTSFSEVTSREKTQTEGLGRRFVLTGGTGFVGQRLAEYLSSRDPAANVCAFGSDTDLSDWNAVSERFEKIAAAGGGDHLVHLAACLKPGGWLARHPAEAYRANTLINLNVFEARRIWLPEAKLTSISSYAIYSSGTQPHTEGEALLGTPEDGLFAYGHAKRSILIAQEAYEREHGLTSASVVLPTVYGPRPGLTENTHLVGALTGKFLRAVRDDAQAVSLWGDGKQVRDFLHIDDAVEGIVHAMERQVSPLINLGSGCAMEIESLARVIADETGFQGRLIFDTDRYAGEPVRRLDVSRARDELGWAARIPLDAGVREFVRWMRERVGSGLEALS